MPLSLIPDKFRAQCEVKAWLIAIGLEPHPVAHEFAKEALCILSMYGAREALRWMHMQTACSLMLASFGARYDDDDLEHDHT